IAITKSPKANASRKICCRARISMATTYSSGIRRAPTGRFTQSNRESLKMSPKAVALVATLMLGSIGIAAAHHSNAAYDLEHMQVVDGTVKQVNWTNPHITFAVETDGKDGKPAETWVFEVSSPGVLTRSGWTKRSL